MSTGNKTRFNGAAVVLASVSAAAPGLAQGQQTGGGAPRKNLFTGDEHGKPNLFDGEYLTYVNNIGFFKLDVFGERQTFGATARYRYH